MTQQPDKPVRILVLEDLPSDANLAQREVRKALESVEFETVETREDFLAALQTFQPDLIISDYQMPSFDGLSALKISLEKNPHTPFIIHTGSQNEDTAVACMKAGATDYVLKERIKRLGPAVKQALEVKALRKEAIETQQALEESEERFRRLAENADDLIYRYEYIPERRFAYVSPSAGKITGYTPEEHYADPDLAFKVFHPDDQHLLEEIAGHDEGMTKTLTVRWIRKDGTMVWVEQAIVYVLDEDGNKVAIEGIVRDITARKEAEEALQKALVKAEENDRLKTAFLNNLSHEIRTPLNAILGFSNMLRESACDQDSISNYVEIINKSGNRLLRIINDIMSISAIETNQVELFEEPTDLCQLLDALYADHAVLAAEKGLSFEYSCDVDADEKTITTDKTKLQKVLEHLLDNALKYTRQGSIGLHCKRKDDQVEIRVTDTGIGIKPEHQKVIFSRFHQVDPESDRVVEGNGLGLAIAQAFIELMGGRIGVESTPGEGSAFYLQLPVG